MESGKRRLSLEELLGLAGLYGVPVLGLLDLGADYLRFGENRSLDAATVAELIIGADAKPGHGGADWQTAARVVLATTGEEDWRPAKAYWRRDQLGYGKGKRK